MLAVRSLLLSPFFLPQKGRKKPSPTPTPGRLGAYRTPPRGFDHALTPIWGYRILLRRRLDFLSFILYPFNNIMHMGEMLERTGRDLGLGDPVFLKAESIEFCSAGLSHRMTHENPARVVNCPFIVAAYVRAKEPDKTYVVYREIPQDQIEASPIMAEVAENLKGIAETGASW